MATGLPVKTDPVTGRLSSHVKMKGLVFSSITGLLSRSQCHSGDGAEDCDVIVRTRFDKEVDMVYICEKGNKGEKAQGLQDSLVPTDNKEVPKKAPAANVHRQRPASPSCWPQAVDEKYEPSMNTQMLLEGSGRRAHVGLVSSVRDDEEEVCSPEVTLTCNAADINKCSDIRSDVTPQSTMSMNVKTQRPKTAGAHRKSTKNNQLRPPAERGTLGVRIKVKNMDLAHADNTDNYMETFQIKVLHFYELMLRDAPLYAAALSSQPAIRGCSVDQITAGSLTARIRCPSEKALIAIHASILEGSLDSAFNRVIITDSLLWELDVARMDVYIDIKASAIKRCQRELALMKKQDSQDRSRTPAPTLNAPSLQPHPRSKRPKTAAATERRRIPQPVVSSDIVETWPLKKCLDHLRSIRRRCLEVDETLGDHLSRHNACLEHLLLTLRLVKPRTLTTFSRLSDVIACCISLKASPSVGRCVRTDLVELFVETVGITRRSIIDTQTKMKNIACHLAAYAGVGPLLAYRKCLKMCLEKTEEEFRFDNESTQDLDIKLNVMDELLFKKMLTYLPMLVEHHCECSGMAETMIDAMSARQSYN